MAHKDFYVGKKFKDFNELAAAIHSLEKQTFCELKKIDSRTVKCANRLKSLKGQFFHEKFKYSYVKYACKHYGNYRSRGKGFRPRQKTHKIGCPMFIHVNTNRHKAEMVVTAVNHEHNHQIEPDKLHVDKKQQVIKPRKIPTPKHKLQHNKRKRSNSSEDDFSPPVKFKIIPLTRKDKQPLLTREEKYNQAFNVLKQIASLASELGEKEFKETMALLKKLKTCMKLREEIQLSFVKEQYKDLNTLYDSAENDEMESISEPSSSDESGDEPSSSDESGESDSNISNYSNTPPSPPALLGIEENSLVDFDITNNLQQATTLSSLSCQNKLQHRGRTFRNDLSFYSNSTEFEERTKLAKNVRVPKLNISRAVCNITIKNLNLQTVEPDGWLDDQIINAYLQLVAKDYPDVYVLPSFVMTVMAKCNGQQSSFFYPKVSFDKKRIILIPVHSDDHWFLLVAEMSSCRLMVLDSFPNHSRTVKFFNLWRKTGGKAWIYFKHPDTATAIHGDIKTVAISEDGKPSLVISRGFTIESVQRHLLKVSNQEHSITTSFVAPVAEFVDIHKKNILSMDISSGGGLGVSSSREETLVVWDTITGSVRRKFEGHFGEVECCRFFPSGVVLLSGGMDTQLKIWSVEDGSCARTLSGSHKTSVNDVAFVDKGKNIVSCSSDGSVRLWDCGSATEIACIARDKAVVNFCALKAISNELQQLLCAGRTSTANKSDLEAGTEDKLLVFGCEDGTLEAICLDSRATAFSLMLSNAVNCCCFVDDLTLAAGCQGGALYLVDLRRPSSPMLVDESTSSHVLTLSPSIRPRGTQSSFWAGFGDGRCALFGVAAPPPDDESGDDVTATSSLRVVCELTGSDCDPIVAVAESANGFVFTACRDGRVRKYKVAP